MSVKVAILGATGRMGKAVVRLAREAARIMLIVFQMWWVLTSYEGVVHWAFFMSFAVSVIVFRMAILVKE